MILNILIPAVRQYRHSSGSDEIFFGYDAEETERIVTEQGLKLEAAYAAIKWLHNCDAEYMLTLDAAIEYEEHEEAIERAIKE